MGDIAYERPIRTAPQSTQIEYENPRSVVRLPQADPTGSKDWENDAKTAAVGAGIGAGAGLLGYGAMILGKKFFPGSKFFNPSNAGVIKNYLQKLDKAFKVRDANSGLKEKFAEYMRDTVNSGRRDYSFLEWAAGKNDPVVNDFIAKTVRSSGKEAAYQKESLGKAFDAKGRVMQSLADAMGVADKSLPQTMDDLIAARRANADPLYRQAFADSRPLRDTRLFDFLGENEPVMQEALKHAEEAFKFDPERAIDFQTAVANAGPRRDSWKRLDANDIPEFLHVGEPGSQLQKYISPNMRTLDKMKQALWELGQSRKKAGMGDYGAINDVRRKFTELLDTVGPDVYKQARAQFKGDIEMQNAAEVGAKLLSMKPNEVQAALSKMAPHEREAAAMGFYGAMKDVEQAKMLRQYVNKPEQYQNQNQVLSYLFQDPEKFNQFMQQLDVEHGIQQATKFGDQGLLSPKGSDTEYMRLSVGPHGVMPSVKGILLDRLSHNETPSILRSRRGSLLGLDAISGKPSFSASGSSAGHPLWGDVEAFDRLPSVSPWVGGGAAAGAASTFVPDVYDSLAGGLNQYSEQSAPAP